MSLYSKQKDKDKYGIEFWALFERTKIGRHTAGYEIAERTPMVAQVDWGMRYPGFTPISTIFVQLYSITNQKQFAKLLLA